jgi:hypothetical protein
MIRKQLLSELRKSLKAFSVISEASVGGDIFKEILRGAKDDQQVSREFSNTMRDYAKNRFPALRTADDATLLETIMRDDTRMSEFYKKLITSPELKEFVKSKVVKALRGVDASTDRFKGAQIRAKLGSLLGTSPEGAELVDEILTDSHQQNAAINNQASTQAAPAPQNAATQVVQSLADKNRELLDALNMINGMGDDAKQIALLMNTLGEEGAKDLVKLQSMVKTSEQKAIAQQLENELNAAKAKSEIKNTKLNNTFNTIKNAPGVGTLKTLATIVFKLKFWILAITTIATAGYAWLKAHPDAGNQIGKQGGGAIRGLVKGTMNDPQTPTDSTAQNTPAPQQNNQPTLDMFYKTYPCLNGYLKYEDGKYLVADGTKTNWEPVKVKNNKLYFTKNNTEVQC